MNRVSCKWACGKCSLQVIVSWPGIFSQRKWCEHHCFWAICEQNAWGGQECIIGCCNSAALERLIQCSFSIQKPCVVLIVQQALLLVTYCVLSFCILMRFSFIQEVSNGIWGRGNSLASFLSTIIFISCCNMASAKTNNVEVGGKGCLQKTCSCLEQDVAYRKFLRQTSIWKRLLSTVLKRDFELDVLCCNLPLFY